MAVFVFVLALLLAIAGGGGLVAGYSLLPIEAGIAYATCGAIALSTAALVAALGALIVRIDANAAKILAAQPVAPLATPIPKPPFFPPKLAPQPPDWTAPEAAAATAPARTGACAADSRARDAPRRRRRPLLNMRPPPWRRRASRRRRLVRLT